MIYGRQKVLPTDECHRYKRAPSLKYTMSKNIVDQILSHHDTYIRETLAQHLIIVIDKSFPEKFWTQETTEKELDFLEKIITYVQKDLKTALTYFYSLLHQHFTTLRSTLMADHRKLIQEEEIKSYYRIWYNAIKQEISQNVHQKEEFIKKGIQFDDNNDIVFSSFESIEIAKIQSIISPKKFLEIQNEIRADKLDILDVFKRKEMDYMAYLNEKFPETIGIMQKSFYEYLHRVLKYLKTGNNLISRMVISRASQEFSPICPVLFELDEISDSIFEEVLRHDLASDTKKLEKKMKIFRKLDYANYLVERSICNKYYDLIHTTEKSGLTDEKVQILISRSETCLLRNMHLHLPSMYDASDNDEEPPTNGPARIPRDGEITGHRFDREIELAYIEHAERRRVEIEKILPPALDSIMRVNPGTEPKGGVLESSETTPQQGRGLWCNAPEFVPGHGLWWNAPEFVPFQVQPVPVQEQPSDRQTPKTTFNSQLTHPNTTTKGYVLSCLDKALNKYI